MIHIYIDTALLAVPNYAVDEASASGLIDRLTHFSALILGTAPMKFLISAGAEELLWSNNCGPYLPEVEGFIAIMGLGHTFSARDLIQQYNVIFDRALRSDEVNPIEVQAISSFSTEPALPVGLNPKFLWSETERIFAAVAALQRIDSWFLGSAIHTVRNELFNTEVNIKAASGKRAHELGSLPVDLVAEVRTFAHIQGAGIKGYGAALMGKRADRSGSTFCDYNKRARNTGRTE